MLRVRVPRIAPAAGGGGAALSGATSLSFTTTGTLAGNAAIVGPTSLTFATTGTLAGQGAISGSTGLAFTVTGTIDDEAAQQAFSAGGIARSSYQLIRRIERKPDKAAIEAIREAAEAARQAEDVQALAAIERSIIEAAERVRAREVNTRLERQASEAALAPIVALLAEFEELRRDEEEAEIAILLAL
jgi:hypothetical protein